MKVTYRKPKLEYTNDRCTPHYTTSLPLCISQPVLSDYSIHLNEYLSLVANRKDRQVSVLVKKKSTGALIGVCCHPGTCRALDREHVRLSRVELMKRTCRRDVYFRFVCDIKLHFSGHSAVADPGVTGWGSQLPPVTPHPPPNSGILKFRGGFIFHMAVWISPR